MAILELYGTKSCQYTQEMREWLEWKGTEFVEYDVEADVAARERMHSLANGQRTVPMLVDGGQGGSDRLAGARLRSERGVIRNGERVFDQSSRRGAGRGLSPICVSAGSREYAGGLGTERGARR